MRTLSLCFLFGLALTPPPPVKAAVIYDNGLPDQVDGQELNAWLQAQDFMLGGAQQVARLRFWTLEAANEFLGSIAWAIYADVAGVPGTALFSGDAAPVVRAATGNMATTLDEFVYEIELGVLLGPGTYWISLHNGPVAAQNSGQIFWGTTASNGSTLGQEFALPGGPWAGNGGEHAFQLLSADVPEPGAAALLLAGAISLILVRKTR
jgi:hypothetical protein